MSAAPVPTLTISLAEPGLQEKRYVLEIMMSRMLGYACRFVEGADGDDCRMMFPGGYRVSLADSFFRRAPDGRYLAPALLPEPPLRLIHPLAPEGDIVFFYGRPDVSESGSVARLGMDLVASAFFLLSRWEEAVVASRDAHGRVPNDELYVRRHGLAARALVNEYAEWMGRLAARHGETLPPRPGHFQIVPTHDVDRLYFQGARDAFAVALRSRLPRRLAAWTLYRLLRIRQERTFSWIMDVSEKAGLRSRFYWMAGGRHPYDLYYRLEDARARDIIVEIRKRGHLIGFHPSYGTMEDEGAWEGERKRLEAFVGAPVREGRQHFLRVSVPRTLRTWDAQGMQTDSSFGFSRGVGFRCGTGCEYPLFDLQNRRPLLLMERPLLVMDAALRGDHAEDARAVLDVVRTCRRYDMPCTILFHNHVLDPVPWNGLRGLYRTILEGKDKG